MPLETGAFLHMKDRVPTENQEEEKEQMKERKGENWCFWKDMAAEEVATGVTRRILAFCDEAMCVENTFQKGAVGSLHHHPHTQITYVASGRFRFTIGGETKEVAAGDTLCKQDGIVHGCECLESGVLVDFFTPMREDFL